MRGTPERIFLSGVFMHSFIFLSQEKGYLFLWLINDPHADPLRVIPVFFSENIDSPFVFSIIFYLDLK